VFQHLLENLRITRNEKVNSVQRAQVIRGIKKWLKYGHARKYFRSPSTTAETIAFLTPFYPLYVAPTKDSRYATSCALTIPPVSSVVSIRSAEGTRQRRAPQKKKKKRKKREEERKKEEEDMTARHDN
jgi:hypothetical protein